MVKVKYKFEHNKVYLKIVVLGVNRYYWFPKAGLNKRFHPRQLFSRSIRHKAYKDNLIPYYTNGDGWVEAELSDKIVKEKLRITVLTETEYYEQLAKAC